MKRTAIIAAVIGFALAALPAAPAQAGAARTFVSPTGSDSNLCTLVAPCRFFQAALAQTNPGGEIAVLGTAGYNNGATVNINKAISIVNPGAFEAGIVVPSGGTGIVINAGPSDAVSLRGLTIEGGGVGTTGIAFNSGAALNIANSVVRNLTSSGIGITPNAGATIVVSHTVVSNNGGHGIYVQPSGRDIRVTALFNRVEVYNNALKGIGLFGNLALGFSNVRATAVDCVAAHNESGYYALAGEAPLTVFRVFRSTAFNNGHGVLAEGGGAVVVSQSNLEENIVSWAQSGGAVASYGDNYVDGTALPGLIPFGKQ